MTELDEIPDIEDDAFEAKPLLAVYTAPAPRTLLDRIFDPTKRRYRYCTLLPLALLTFGPYYCLTLPTALQIQLQKDLNLDVAEYSIFNSLSTWPNIVLCFLGGTLIDRFFSIRIGAPVFAFVVMAGQILFAAGAYYNILWVMFIGRFLIG
jgi:MFS family permease